MFTPPVAGTEFANPRGDHSDPVPMRPTVDPIPAPDPLVTVRAQLRETEAALSLTRRQLEAMQRESSRFANMYLEKRAEAATLHAELDEATTALTNALAAVRLAVGGIRHLKTKGSSKLAKRLERALEE